MVVKTHRSEMSEDGSWIVYMAHVWVQYSDGEEYSVCVPLQVPTEAPEQHASYALHDWVCQRVMADQLFNK